MIKKPLTVNKTIQLIQSNRNFAEAMSSLNNLSIELYNQVRLLDKVDKEKLIEFFESRKNKDVSVNDVHEFISLNIISIDDPSLKKIQLELRTITLDLHQQLRNYTDNSIITQAFNAMKVNHPKARESEYDHCVNNTYYYYSLALMECFYGNTGGASQQSCIDDAGWGLQINIVYCMAECSQFTANCA